MSGVIEQWVVYVDWGDDHTSPAIGPFDRVKEAEDFAKKMRAKLRGQGRFRNGMVYMRLVVSPGRALSWYL